MMAKGQFAHLVVNGAVLCVRATPRAKSARLSYDGGIFHIAVTAPAEDGRANMAVTEALAQALGVAKSRLTLTRGATSRDKCFRLE